MSTDAVLFDYDDVLPVIQRAHSEGSRDDAEEATSQACVELYAKGVPLTAANVITRARSRLIDAKKRRYSRNLSLDAALEKDIDQAPVEFAVEEVDFDAHVQLREAAANPVLAARLAVVRAGGEPWLARRGENHPRCRYPDSVVKEARRLHRRTDLTYTQIAIRLGVKRPALVGRWCRGTERAVTGSPVWSREFAILAIQAFIQEEGRRPNFKDLKRDPRLPSLKVIKRLFGRWGEALDAAGVQWRDEPFIPKWTPERALTAFRTFFNRNGHRPTTREFRAAGSGLPAYGVLERLFRTTSLTKVCDLAGLPA